MKQNLALVDELSAITNEEAEKFVKDLDMMVDPKAGGALKKELLKPAWEEGRKFLKANQDHLLRIYRLQELKALLLK